MVSMIVRTGNKINGSVQNIFQHSNALCENRIRATKCFSTNELCWIVILKNRPFHFDLSVIRKRFGLEICSHSFLHLFHFYSSKTIRSWEFVRYYSFYFSLDFQNEINLLSSFVETKLYERFRKTIAIFMVIFNRYVEIKLFTQ